MFDTSGIAGGGRPRFLAGSALASGLPSPWVMFSRCFWLLTLLPATTAAASDDPAAAAATVAAESRHRTAGVFANLGLFSATGFGGLSYAHVPSNNWVFEAGVGYGLTGFQLSLMPKLTHGQNHRFVLGLGPSVGLGRERSGLSLWLNGDIGYEYRADDGFSVSLVVGFTQGIAGCIADQCRPGGAGWGDESDERAFMSERAADWVGPQGRIIIGKWF
jgi:hypothetical protein